MGFFPSILSFIFLLYPQAAEAALCVSCIAVEDTIQQKGHVLHDI